MNLKTVTFGSFWTSLFWRFAICVSLSQGKCGLSGPSCYCVSVYEEKSDKVSFVCLRLCVNLSMAVTLGWPPLRRSGRYTCITCKGWTWAVCVALWAGIRWFCTAHKPFAGSSATRRIPSSFRYALRGQRKIHWSGVASSNGGLCGLFSCNGRMMKNNEMISKKTRLDVFYF